MFYLSNEKLLKCPCGDKQGSVGPSRFMAAERMVNALFLWPRQFHEPRYKMATRLCVGIKMCLRYIPNQLPNQDKLMECANMQYLVPKGFFLILGLRRASVWFNI